MGFFFGFFFFFFLFFFFFFFIYIFILGRSDEIHIYSSGDTCKIVMKVLVSEDGMTHTDGVWLGTRLERAL